MGRPINKKYFGATGASDATIPVRFQSGGSVYEGYIVRQLGSKKFECSTDDGTTAVEICTLTSDGSAPNANGECSIVDNNGVGMIKISAHKCTDASGNVYTWEVEDDSTESIFRTTLTSQ